jgi:ABC-2 type transport system permease protein
MTWLAEARALFERDWLTDLRYRAVFVVSLVDAGLALVSYGFLARVFGDARPDGYAPLPFLLAGIALTDSLTTGLVSMAQGVRQNQQAGTMKALLALPLSPARVMALSMPYPALRAAVDFAVFLAVGAALGLSLAGINVLSMSVVLVLAIAAVLGLGLMSAAVAVVFKRGDPVMWALGAATWLLSGVLYPVDVLPPLFARLAWCLPTTHALAAMRAAVLDGVPLADLGAHLTALAGFAVVLVPGGLWLFSAAVNYARRKGTLGHL